MRKLGTLAFASVSLIAIATPAWAAEAQDAAAAEDTASAPSEIVVQARRRDERLIDVPKVVNVVSADDIHKLNVQRLDDVQALVPGLNIQNSNNGVAQTATIRGIGFDVNSGAAPTVEFYLNDASMQQNVVFQAMYDIGHIEVLRGPQGTLRGRASPSGSITITTKQPDLYDAGGFVDGSWTTGVAGGLQGSAGFNMPIVEGKLAIRVAGLVDDNKLDGVRSAYSSVYPDKPSSRTWSGRASFLFAPTDNLQIRGTYQRLEKHQHSFIWTQSICAYDATVACDSGDAGTEYVGRVDASDRLSTVNGERDIEQRQNVFTWGADWTFAGQKLSYVGSYAKGTVDRAEPQDQAAALLGLTETYGFQDDQLLHSVSKYKSHEIRLSSDERIAGIFDYTLGFFTLNMPTRNVVTSPLVLSDAAFNTPCDQISPTCPTTLPFGTVLASEGMNFVNYGGTSGVDQAYTAFNDYGVRKEQSIFGNVTAHIGAFTEISGGIRAFLKATNHDVNSVETVNMKSKPVIWTASVSHHFTPDLMVYASAGSSFRQGPSSIGPVAYSNGNALSADVLQYVNLKDEKSKSYEAGVKTQFFDRKVWLNFAYYHQDFSNYLYAVPGNVSYLDDSYASAADLAAGHFHTSSGFLANLPVKVDGVEMDLGYRPTPNFSIAGTVSYAKSRVTGGDVPCNGGYSSAADVAGALAGAYATDGSHILTCSAKGLPASYSPRFTLTVQSEYSHELTNELTGYVRGLLNYYSKTPHNADLPYNDQDRYALVNLYAGVRDKEKGWDLGFFVKNLFKNQTVLANYAGNMVTYTDLTTETLNSGYAVTNMTLPRQFGINFHMTFGSDK